MTEQPTARRRAAGRSPNYPGIALGTAIERARAVFEAEGRHWAPIARVTKLMGYKNPDTGPATISYAALKKFGLLEEQGSGKQREARISELGFSVLRAPEPERTQSIRTAAMLPPIHRDMQQRFPEGFPSEETLTWRLVQELHFTEGGAQDFIRKFQATLSFAGLTISDTVPGDEPQPGEDDHRDPDPEPGQSGQRAEQQPRSQWRGGVSGNVLTIPVPIVGGTPVTIEGQFPITEAAWVQFLAVLNAMKPGLVADPEPVAPEPDTHAEA